MDTVQVPQELLPLLVGYIKQSAELLKEAAATEEKQAAAGAGLSGLAAIAVKELSESGLLAEGSIKSATAGLAGDHAMALKSLTKVAKSIRPFAMGNAPEAGGTNIEQQYPGSTKTSEADDKFLRALGI